MSPSRALLALTPIALTIAACGGNEPPTADDHTPVRYSVMLNGALVTAPYTFTSGATTRVQIKFFNAADEDLDVVESGHFGGLTFNPTSRATATRLADHHFQFDVVGGTPGAGTMQVSFGHDELADEVSFPAVTINVTP